MPMASSYIHMSQGCLKVDITNVKACISCSFGADDAVPHYFGGGDVCCSGSQLSREFDEVAACCDTYPVSD